MLLLGLDLETTGRDIMVDQAIEVGAVLWDTDKAKPLKIFSEMVFYDEIWKGATSTKEDIERLIKVSYSELQQYGKHPLDVYHGLKQIMSIPDIAAVVAHNGNEFDKPLLLNNLKRWGIEIPNLPWIDTMIDIPYSPEIKARKLPYIAAEHGFLNPFAHRAIFDVLTMLKIVQFYDIEWILKVSKEPIVTLVANTVHPREDGGHSNEVAKSRGFHYDVPNKRWIKVVRESQVQTEKNAISTGCWEIKT